MKINDIEDDRICMQNNVNPCNNNTKIMYSLKVKFADSIITYECCSTTFSF